MKFVDNSESFNYDMYVAQFNYGGCIGSRACMKCGVINNGTCLCMNIFTCINCKHEHTGLPRNLSINKVELEFTNNYKIIEKEK